MKIIETGVSLERIAALEQRLREMDAEVKGLINELLDFKAIAMTMSLQIEESSTQEISKGSAAWSTTSPSVTAPAEGSTVIRLKGANQPDAPVVPAEPAMVRIMQPDGTMKMERRHGDETTTNLSRGYRGTRKGTS